jgi:hypothetical protein
LRLASIRAIDRKTSGHHLEQSTICVRKIPGVRIEKLADKLRKHHKPILMRHNNLAHHRIQPD